MAVKMASGTIFSRLSVSCFRLNMGNKVMGYKYDKIVSIRTNMWLISTLEYKYKI